MKLLPLALISLLFFIFPIPGTNALRYILAVILLVFSIYNCQSIGFDKVRIILSSKYSKGFFLGLLTLTVYILVHSIFISHEMYWSLKEFKGHWLNPVLFLFLGIFLTIIAQRKTLFTPKALITAIFFSMFFHILYLDFVALKALYTSGTLISRYGGLTESPVLANYLSNILLAFALADFLSRERTQVSILPISKFWLYIVMIMLIFSLFIESMRNGIFILLLTSIIFLFFYFYQNKKFSSEEVLSINIFVLVIFSVLLIYNLKSDSRWSSFIETVPIAFDTESNEYWKDRKNRFPSLSNGNPVSESNYERIAWIAKGVEYVKDNPIGIGFGRNAFGHAIQLYEGVDSARGKHSHSSIIDLTIGIGLIGLILWLVMICYLLIFFFKSFKKSPNFYSISGFMLTSGFFLRSIIDSNMRDHMFQQFFILLGIIIVLSFYETLTEKNESS